MSAHRVAWAIWAATMALSAVAIAMLAVTLDVPVPDAWGFRGFAILAALGFGTIGLLIVARRSDQLIGWLLLASGIAGGVQGSVEEYGIFGVLAHPGSLPGAVQVASLMSWIWIISTFLVGIYVPLLFPDGRLPSPRWRPVAYLAAVAAIVVGSGYAFADGPAANATYVRNAFGIPGFPATDFIAAGFAMWFVAGFASAGSVVWRFRRAKGLERQQIKWLAYGAALAAVGAIAGSVTESKLGQYVYFLAIGAIPGCVTIAILRYRLYDIDLIVRRTVVYGTLSAILVAAYVVFVILFQAILRPVTAGSEIAVAASTLAVIALVRPLLRRIQGAVDRRFDRSHYDAARALDTLATRLRDEVDIDAVRAEIVGVVSDAVRPLHASLWLREQRS